MLEKENDRISQLAQRASDGDRSAFSELVREFMSPIMALTYRMTGERESALDLAQDTFVSAWESFRKFRGDAKIESWLYRIAMNKSLNYLAHRKISATTELTDDLPARSSVGPDAQMIKDELKAHVLAFMAGLPEQQRAVFELRFYRQMQFDEIAEILGRGVPTVKTNYREAIKKLREVAEREGWRP